MSQRILEKYFGKTKINYSIAFSHTQIPTKLSTNYDSVKNNCDELEIYDLAKVKELKGILKTESLLLMLNSQVKDKK